MVNSVVEILGLVAGAFTTIAFVPQVLKSLQTKRTKDISIGWIVLVIVGVFLWLIYGLLVNDVPVIVANLFTEIFALTVLIAKLKYG